MHACIHASCMHAHTHKHTHTHTMAYGKIYNDSVDGKCTNTLFLLYAENALKKKVQLEGGTLTVQPNLSTSSRNQSTQPKMGNGKQHASKGHDHDSVQRVIAPRNVILVSGIKETTTGELLKMFFENKRRSGGGPVKKLDYQSTKGQATISFHSEEGRHLLFPVNNHDKLHVLKTQN